MAVDEMVGLRAPEQLRLRGEGGEVYEGGDQEWYGGYFQRLGGCGPTTASHQAWYLARTRPHCAALCDPGDGTRADFRRLMDSMWRYVTPGMRGVHKPSMFVDGITQFGADRGVALGCAVLEIPQQRDRRPDWTAASGFLRRALQADLPVAFLNLDNGGVSYLDSWHWVTLIRLGPGAGYAVILDAGKAREITLDRWLQRSKAGGGFVVTHPLDEPFE